MSGRVGQVRKRDANEPAIVRALERIGCLVKRISEPGFADLVASRHDVGVRLIEVKRPKVGRLTPQQIAYRRNGWPIHIVENEAEALALFGVTQ